MGRVTDEIIGLIRKQLDDHGLVVFYDPERTYADVVGELSPKTVVLSFLESFFELRHRIEAHLEYAGADLRFLSGREAPPRLLIYVPRDRGANRHALIEAELAGVVLEPGANPWQRNTRLKVLAERVFKRIAPDRASAIAAEVEAGRRTLAELDWLADQSGDLGAVQLVFGTTSPMEVILAFIGSDQQDEAIVAKTALPELSSLFQTELGLVASSEQPVSTLRKELVRTLLLSELVLKVREAGGEVSKLNSIPLPDAARQQEQVLSVCRQWRNRLDLREVYAAMAGEVETEAQVMTLELDVAALADVETFACIEPLLLESAESILLEGKLDEANALASRRRSSFWSAREGELQLRWTLLDIAGKLLRVAESIEAQLKTVGKDAADLIEAYSRGPSAPGSPEPMPWYLLDRHHRHLEHRYALLDFQPGGSHAHLEKVVSHVRRRYEELVGRCAEHLTDALVASHFEVPNVTHHDEVFRKRVHVRMGEGQTAYFLVDALRYEMARELIEGLGEGFDVDLTPGLAQLPSITEVGMAMLMPGADQGAELMDAGRGRVAIRLGETTLKDRASRVKHFESSVPGKTLVLKLNDLMKPSKKRREAITEADVVLVTSQEIDRRGEETSDEEEARRFMDEVLEKLRRGIRTLASLGVRNMVLSADHGHVFVDELEPAMKVDAPGGQTVDLHSRVWIGRGGAESDSYVRVSASQLGLGGDLELAFPRGLACFRSRGRSGGFFHGGISLQELVIPVISLVAHDVRAPALGTVAVTISLAKPKVTTRFFSVEVKYVISGLFGDDTKRVKVVARTGRTDVAAAAMAAYGFEEGTQEVLLEKDRPNAVTMMLTTEVDSPTLSIHVLDATTQVELASTKNIPVEITI